MSTMTKSEREDLQRLIRQREKVLKSAAKQRSAELLADFENQMGQEYSFDQDAVWEQAVKLVDPIIAKAQEQIAKRCHELGIPAQFAPAINLSWHARGYGNSLAQRRVELRRMAQTQIAAIEAAAVMQIGLSCLEAQTELAVAGLTSEAAKRFVERIPKIETLMPALSFREVAGGADPPVAEQLVSSNALRQRRFRDRQRMREDNGSEALQGPLRNAGGDGGNAGASLGSRDGGGAS